MQKQRYQRQFPALQVHVTAYNYLCIENAEGYVLIAVYLFIYLRVTRITQKILNRIA